MYEILVCVCVERGVRNIVRPYLPLVRYYVVYARAWRVCA